KPGRGGGRAGARRWWRSKRRRRAKPARSSKTTGPATRRSSPSWTTSKSSESEELTMALSKIWVLAEAADGSVSPTTLELLTKARELGDTVECVYAGGDADAIAGDLG